MLRRENAEINWPGENKTNIRYTIRIPELSDEFLISSSMNLKRIFRKSYSNFSKSPTKDN